eukprot:783276-Rhodomonas_salina.2
MLDFDPAEAPDMEEQLAAKAAFDEKEARLKAAQVSLRSPRISIAISVFLSSSLRISRLRSPRRWDLPVDLDADGTGLSCIEGDAGG